MRIKNIVFIAILLTLNSNAMINSNTVETSVISATKRIVFVALCNGSGSLQALINLHTAIPTTTFEKYPHCDDTLIAHCSTAGNIHHVRFASLPSITNTIEIDHLKRIIEILQHTKFDTNFHFSTTITIDGIRYYISKNGDTICTHTTIRDSRIQTEEIE